MLEKGNCFLLVCVEHRTGWPVVAPNVRATAEVVKEVMETMIIPPFGAPVVVFSDSAACFTPGILQNFMKGQGMQWRTILAYALMSNGRAESMVATLKRSFGRILNSCGHDCNVAVTKAVFGYRCSPGESWLLPFELLYGVKPRMVPLAISNGDGPSSINHRQTELLALLGPRAKRVDRQQQRPKGLEDVSERKFEVGDTVLVGH